MGRLGIEKVSVAGESPRRVTYSTRASESGGETLLDFESEFGCSSKIISSTSWITAFIFRKYSLRFTGSRHPFRLCASALNWSANFWSRDCRVVVIATLDTRVAGSFAYGDDCRMTNQALTAAAAEEKESQAERWHEFPISS